MNLSTLSRAELKNWDVERLRALAKLKRLGALPSPRSDFSAYRDRPVDFCREVLGGDPWQKQQEIMRAVATQPHVTVRSGRGVGKTWVAAQIALWFLASRPGSIVITTAPTGRQVRDLLWRQIRASFSRARHPLPGRCLTTQIDCGPDWYATGFATDEEVRFQGPHCLSTEHTILTRRGWLGLDEISLSDEVLSVPLHGETAEWMPITAIHRYPFKGELNVLESTKASFAVTDEHRFPAKRDARWGKWEMIPYHAINTGFVVRASSGWKGEPFAVPAPFAAYGWYPEQFAEFLGFWIGDGGLRMHGKTGRFYEVLLYQVKPDGGYSRGLLPNVRVRTGRDHVVFCNWSCAEWLAEHVGRYGAERRIPRFVLDGPPSVLEAFAEGFWHAEGTLIKGEKRQVYNTNIVLMDQIQELLIKLGRPSKMGVNRIESEGRSIKGKRKGRWRECRVLSWLQKPTDRFLNKKNNQRKPYEGEVWCISTPYQTFYTRRNGCVLLSGNSAAGVLIVGDEAAGLPEWFHTAVEGLQTQEGAKLLLIGNPNYAGGGFYESHRHWGPEQRFHISALEAPEHLVRPGWCAEMLDKYGKESPVYQVHVLGNFPPQGADSIISMVWVEAAMARDLEAGEPVEMGVDVARYGSDDSAVYVRAGSAVVASDVWHGNDTMETAGRVAALANAWNPSRIKVDEIGVGAGVLDRLVELGLPAEGLNVSTAALDTEHFANRRAEIFDGLATRLKEGDISLPPEDTELLNQLTMLTIRYNSRGQRLLVSKEELRKHGLASPDRADALALCFAAGDDSGLLLGMISQAVSRGGWMPKR